MTISDKDLKKMKSEQVAHKQEVSEVNSEINDIKRKAEVQQEFKKRERQILGLDKPVQRTGFLRFNSYESKLRMMDTALFLFGLKLHKQVGSVEFFDADFSNTIIVKTPYFIDKTLEDCNKIINETLRLGGFTGELLEVGSLKDIEDFDLNKIIVRKGLKISIRFNSFPLALQAF